MTHEELRIPVLLVACFIYEVLIPTMWRLVAVATPASGESCMFTATMTSSVMRDSEEICGDRNAIYDACGNGNLWSE